MRLARWLTKPAHCFAIFNVVVAAWHLPPMYNYALAHHPIHIVQHLMFLVASVLHVVADPSAHCPSCRASAIRDRCSICSS